MGSKLAGVIRSKLQAVFFKLGCFSERFSWAILAVGFAILIGLSVGIITAKIETDVEKLWMEVGGRLEKELQYTRNALGEGSGTTNELLIHAPNTQDDNFDILSVESLQQHLAAVQKAIDVKVDMFDRTWSHSDLCYVPEIPSFNIPLVDGIIQALIPCLMVSPLDCFWDGAKVLKLRGAIPMNLNSGGTFEWTALDPATLLGLLKILKIEGEAEITAMFHEAGISSGYVKKPCLDPTEGKCPATAPNKNSKKPANVSKELSGGCRGFATEFMKWAEEMIVGGTEKNNVTLISAKALQTILVLSGPQGLYKRWAGQVNQLNTEWSIDSARQVLEAWQRQFTKEINADVDEADTSFILAFDSASITDLLKEFSNTSTSRIAIGYVLMLVYACITLRRWCHLVNSHSALGFAGVLLVTLSVAAGLGFCALCRVPFNAASTQVLPFLALGLGVDDMFLLAHTYASHPLRKDSHPREEVGYIIGTIGVSVFLTSFNNMLAFFLAAIIPIPALRYFAIQAGVVVIFNFIGVIVIFPAMIALDIRRRKSRRLDVLCCFKRPSLAKGAGVIVLSGDDLTATNRNGISGSNEYTSIASPPSYTGSLSPTTKSASLPPEVVVNDYVNGTKKHSNISYDSEANMPGKRFNSNPSSGINSMVVSREDSHENVESCEDTFRVLSLSHFATAYYGPFLQKNPVKVVVLILFAGLLAAGIYGSLQVEEGLELTDVVPRDSIAHKFVEAQFKYFSFYPMELVTQEGFDYAGQQKTLYSYHDAFKEIPYVIREPDSDEIPRFWMMYFRTWLKGIQASFDQDWSNNAITFSGWHGNASDTGVIAYKLLAHTGNGDELKRSQVRNFKLVNDEGIIRPAIFYKALTIWIDRDVLGYAFSQADIRPKTSNWTNIRSPQNDDAMRVPTAEPITYAEINLNLIGLKETSDFVKVIKDVRAICDRFSDDGLPNYPSGVPFTFWEQYIKLGTQIITAISVALVVSFVVMAAMLFNIWAAAIIVLVLLMITVEVYGFMGLVGIKLSAVPAVTLILSVGVGVEFTVHLCIAFLTSIGSRNQRMQSAIEHVFVPIVDGAISTLLGVVMLAGSEFEFIVRYFFHLLVALIVSGTLNGLLLLPVLLSLVGPGSVAEEIVIPSTTTSVVSQNPPTDPSPAESALNVLDTDEDEVRSPDSYGRRKNDAGTAPSDFTPNDDKSPDHGSLLGRTYQGLKHGAQVEPVDDGSENEGVDMERDQEHRTYDARL